MMLSHKWGGMLGHMDASTLGFLRRSSSDATPLDGPARFSAALAAAWEEIDDLTISVADRGLVPRFGQQAQTLVRRAVDKAGCDSETMETGLDAPLEALFRRQLQTLRAVAVDRYDAEILARPNPFVARRAAEQAFLDGASELVRPGANWSFDAELQDFAALVGSSYDHDVQLVEEQAKRGQGGHITIEVIRELQEQAAAVQRMAERRGAFPWNIRWQYFLEKSPLGFRGQYAQGRSVIEMLLMPSPDPRLKNNILNRIGPLNVAVSFDMLR